MTNAEWAAALRQALDASGKTQAEVARAVGVHQSTISRWLKAEDQPHGRHLHPLAAFLDAPYLAIGQEGRWQDEERVLQLLLELVEPTVAGKGLPGVWDAKFGMKLTAKERRALASAAPVIREGIRQAAGDDWELLSEDQRLELLRRLVSHLPSYPGSERSDQEA